MQKRCQSVWEFDNKFMNDGHTVVKRTFRGIWRTITFNVILTINNAISKNLPSSGTKCLPIMTYIHPPDTSVQSKHMDSMNVQIISLCWTSCVVDNV